MSKYSDLKILCPICNGPLKAWGLLPLTTPLEPISQACSKYFCDHCVEWEGCAAVITILEPEIVIDNVMKANGRIESTPRLAT